MIATLYLILTLFAFGGGIVSIFGWMNDHNNRYPLPLLIAALVAGIIGQMLVPASGNELCPATEGLIVQARDWGTHPYHECNTNNECHFINRYRVRLDGNWIDVTDDAVITEPNRAGRTMVWPMYNDGAITVRCFMPGSMT